jgi:galactokinase
VSVKYDCIERATDAFGRTFNAPPTHGGIAPGRVNLIGEHTDYTGGYVLPIAIDLRCAAVGRVADGDRRFRAHAADLNETIAFDPTSDPDQLPVGHWGRYVAGVIAGFIERGCDVPGLDICVATDVPLGGGLSSSAALEVAVARLITSICAHEIDAIDEALLCQRAEHTWAGVPCGVMDQMSAAMSRAGHAMLIDCASLETQHVPMPAEDVARIAVFNTNVKHALADSEYTTRRAACERATRVLGVWSLREATLAMIDAMLSALSDEESRCARHVVSENERTVAAAHDLQSGDLAELGKLMAQSHASLRDDMRVSCEELDTLVELAVACEGVYGARMTGGGFGGCAIALIESSHFENAAHEIARRYDANHSPACSLICACSSDGARQIDV